MDEMDLVDRMNAEFASFRTNGFCGIEFDHAAGSAFQFEHSGLFIELDGIAVIAEETTHFERTPN